ncbi:unnamed protein product [Tilletia laevis]|uniref:DNA 3'-5' helicase n=1 Tax=Tilletia laevis TaxID=157183 RepID=A0A9N8QKT5_9BASI|nr:unnamed protein product [Tilletia laevis]
MQEGFRTGSVRVVVATEAGGMGIDISDIARIVQFSLPPDLKGLAQHFGRAMRDPSRAGRAILLAPQWAFDPQASVTVKLALKVPKGKDAAARRANMDAGLRKFINHCDCRRRVLLDTMRLEPQVIEAHIPGRRVRLHDVCASSASSTDRCVRILPNAESELGPEPEPTSSSNIHSAASRTRPRWDTVIMRTEPPAARTGSSTLCCDVCAASSAGSSESTNPFQIGVPPPVPQNILAAVGTSTKAAYIPRPPPPAFETARRELANSLRSWRSARFKAKQLPPFLDSSCLLSDQAIVNLVAQCVRLMVQNMHGGSLDPPYLRSLLQTEHVLMDEASVIALQSHLQVWLPAAVNRHGHLIHQFRLTSVGELPRDRIPSTLTRWTASTHIRLDPSACAKVRAPPCALHLDLDDTSQPRANQQPRLVHRQPRSAPFLSFT